MKRFFVFAALILAVPAASAYQVTGPVLEVTNDTIVVEKNKEKWEIQRDKDTKVAGELKKGSRVTVQYKMIATSIDSKDSKDKGSDKDAKGAGKDSKGAAKKDATPAKKETAPAR
jgi:hypothetical protein